MKRFSFPLESVLALRLREEELTQHTHAAALQTRARIDADLQVTERQIGRCHEAMTDTRSGRSRRDDHLIFLNTLQLQQKNRDRLTRDLAAAQRTVELRREELLVARRRRETLTRLKDKQQQMHRAESLRAEEAELADLITARHAISLMEVGL